MNERGPLSTPAKLNAAAFAVTAAGMLLQIASGSELYPEIPPGPIILLVGAGVVVLGPRRLSAFIGLVVPLILTAGGTIASVGENQFLAQLTDPTDVGIFTGTLVHLLGLIAALITGIFAIRGYTGGQEGPEPPDRVAGM
jgi:hypothetical protein